MVIEKFRCIFCICVVCPEDSALYSGHRKPLQQAPDGAENGRPKDTRERPFLPTTRSIVLEVLLWKSKP